MRILVALGLAAGVLVACGSGDHAAPTTGKHTASSTATRPSQSARAAPVGAAFTNPKVVAALLSDASSDIVTANSYDYRQLSAFRRAALAVTTGHLTPQLADAIDGLIATEAPKLHARQGARVSEAGVTSMTAYTAEILVFGQLVAHNTAHPKGYTNPFQASASLTNVGDRWLLSRLATGGSARCAPPGTPGLADAAAAAEAGAPALTTYHRRTFNADYAHTLALTTGSLRQDLESQKAQTLQTLRDGHFDLHSRVTACAVASADGDHAVVLVALNGYKSTSRTATPQELAVTVDLVGTRWLLSDVRELRSS
jgi:hypothetical protein